MHKALGGDLSDLTRQAERGDPRARAALASACRIGLGALDPTVLRPLNSSMEWSARAN